MSRHTLSPLFEPRSLLTVSDRPLPLLASLPAGLRARTVELARDRHGTPILPPELRDPRERPDLAVVAVESASVPAVLAGLAPARPHAAVVITHDPSPEVSAFCRRWASDNDCRLLGPHSFGFQRPHAGLNASVHPQLARPGRVALVTQSRSIMAVVMDWADDNRTGFSTVVSLGAEAVLDVPRVLDYLVADARTDSIALYLEEVGNAREFMSAIRAAASVKPVAILKARRGGGARTGAPPSPSASAIPPDVVFDAALRRAGAVRVRYFVQLFSSVKALSFSKRPTGGRIAVLSNGSGPAQLALDLTGGGTGYVRRAELAASTREALRARLGPAAWVDNPVIDFSPASASTFADAVRCLVADPGLDGLLVVLAPDPEADMHAVAQALTQVAPAASKPVITCFMGDAAMRPLRRLLDDVGSPAFRTPESAVDAFGNLAAYRYNQQLLLQTPPPEPPGPNPDLGAARALLDRGHAEKRQALDEAQSKALLKAFHIPVAPDTPAQNSAHDVAEVAIQVARDPLFGPVIRFGGAAPRTESGSSGVELPPLNGFLARRLIERTQVWRQLLSTRATTAALDALEDLLVRVSEIVCALPDIASLDIDPIVVDGDRVWAAGARVCLVAGGGAPLRDSDRYEHMAIHPYPARMVRQARFADGTPYAIRPIRPEDAEALQAFTRGLSEHTRYMRFVSVMRELSPRMLARYTQIDYHRELALVATVPPPAGQEPAETIVGVARYLLNPDGTSAEYALVIADDWQRRGLGARLMGGLIEAARRQGLERLEGYVLGNNSPMLKLMQKLGFAIAADPGDASMRRVSLALDADPPQG